MAATFGWLRLAVFGCDRAGSRRLSGRLERLRDKGREIAGKAVGPCALDRSTHVLGATDRGRGDEIGRDPHDVRRIGAWRQAERLTMTLRELLQLQKKVDDANGDEDADLNRIGELPADAGVVGPLLKRGAHLVEQLCRAFDAASRPRAPSTCAR